MIKKISVAILLLGVTALAQAEYKIFIGLTDKYNGPLPDSSIVMKNNTTVTDPVPPVVAPERCFYTQNVYSWRTTVGGANATLYWNGQLISGVPSAISGITTFESNGYIYEKGEQQTFSGPPYFKICRDPILL